MQNNTLATRSIKSRLLLSSIIWLLPVVLLVAILIPQVINEHLHRNVKTQIDLLIDLMEENLALTEEGALAFEHKMPDPRFRKPYGGLYWQITTPTSQLLSRSLWNEPVVNNEQTRVGPKGETLIYIERQVFLEGYPSPISILVGRDNNPIAMTTQKLMKDVWLIFMVFILCLIAIITVQVGWAIRPLVSLQEELEKLKNGEVTSLTGRFPLEVSPLVESLNTLVFHYQDLLERAQNHAGNLSHALKTPLSIFKNLVKKVPETERAEWDKPLNDMQHYIDYHLGRSKMAGSPNILSVSSCPAERVDAMEQAFNKVYSERGIVLVNELDNALYVAVERRDLDEMLGNLIENAYKWANSVISVSLAKGINDEVTIIIEDDGPGVPENKLNEITQRGYRLDETTPGTGLGLNIVAEMAHSYRGKVGFEAGVRGGLKACLTLRQANSK
ncbi:ATP-binding protein [Shewanella canadensis]|uniref:histidine kinase n=1 Tax=Shewanella canadensis TaxID=271096 RepID=A0A3S0KVP2_9GAMM|nr:ATP-binding protein [Shewanella canadensis]RTR39553.1 ATP-binding protein [Shewanella canadensis]